MGVASQGWGRGLRGSGAFGPGIGWAWPGVEAGTLRGWVGADDVGGGVPRGCGGGAAGRALRARAAPGLTLQPDKSGQGRGLGVSTWSPFLASQRYSVQLSTRLRTQVSLG